MKRSSLTVVLFALLLAPGCGYTVGPNNVREYRSVHVPVFQSESFRRGFELQLTEAVQKQIQLSTTYRLTKEPQADTRLIGRIIEVSKRVDNQNRYDDPRELELSLAVEIRWEDTRSGALIAERNFPVASNVTQALSQTSFAPEAGQSLATATKDAVDQMARQIVQLMDTPW